MNVVTVERRETTYGSWTSALWKPDPHTPLAGGVERIWYFDGMLNAARERVFPDGTLELIVQLDTPHRPGVDGPADRFPPVCATGLRTTAEVVEAPAGRCRVLGLIVAPTAAFALLREALPAMTGTTVDLHDAVGRSAAGELAARVHGAQDARAAIRAAAGWVEERLARAPAPNATVDRALAMIVADGGSRSIAAIDAWHGRSRARFTASFRDRVGVSPKRFARIVRFSRALDGLAHRRLRLGDIALAAGYYDQAHFTSEFRTHAGMTPREYVHARRYPDSASVVEREQNFQDTVAVNG